MVNHLNRGKLFWLQGGFGLGALNDADEDDLDVYDHTAGHARSRHAFDISDIHDEERVVIGGRGAKPDSTTLPTPSVSPYQLLEGWVECSRIPDTIKWSCHVPRWQACITWL